jgi:hypothetical protein
MPMTEEDKNFISKKVSIAAVGLAVAILVGPFVAALIAGHYLRIEGRALIDALNRVTTVHGSGTPVVLVGDSLRFKAGDPSYGWQSTDSALKYFVKPSYTVQTIVIKSKPDGSASDDTNQATDKLRIDVSNAAVTSWQVDEYIAASENQVASILWDTSADDTKINLTASSGYLCPNGRTLNYGTSSGCTDSLAFSKIVVSVGLNGGARQPWGSINCVDLNGNQGICRIVFR